MVLPSATLPCLSLGSVWQGCLRSCQSCVISFLQLVPPLAVIGTSSLSSFCHEMLGAVLTLWGFMASVVWQQNGEARVCPFRISLPLPAWLQFSSFRFRSSTLRYFGDVFYLVWEFLKSITVWNWYYKQNTNWSRDEKTLSIKWAWSKPLSSWLFGFSTFERASTSSPTTL